MVAKTKTKQNARNNLREIVIQSVRNDILSGALSPGERLMEKNLAGQIGVSRTPVREALSKLEQEGFVEIIPRRGAVVSVIKSKDIRNVLEIRAVLEALAARLSCGNGDGGFVNGLERAMAAFAQAMEENNIGGMTQSDIDFHDVIYAASGNEKLLQMISNLRDQMHRYRVHALRDRDYRREVVTQHARIFEAIRDRDGERAAAAAFDHVSRQKKVMMTGE